MSTLFELEGDITSIVGAAHLGVRKGMIKKCVMGNIKDFEELGGIRVDSTSDDVILLPTHVPLLVALIPSRSAKATAHRRVLAEEFSKKYKEPPPIVKRLL